MTPWRTLPIKMLKTEVPKAIAAGTTKGLELR